MVKKILVVDDEKDIRDSVQTALKSQGYNVEISESGKSALKLLKKKHFDLVLLDIFMPMMSGREVLEKIRGDPAITTTKVAFLSVAKLSEAGAKVIKALKPAAYLNKPIDLEVLLKAVKKLLK